MWVLALIAATLTVALGDTLYLKSGQDLDGKLVSRKAGKIRFRVKRRVREFEETRVLRLESPQLTLGLTLREVYRHRAAKLTFLDVKGRFALAQWLRRKQMLAEMRSELKKVLAIEKDHKGALKMLSEKPPAKSKTDKQAKREKGARKNKKPVFHKLAPKFEIHRVIIASNFTANAGTWAEVRLTFKNFVRVKWITIVWYGLTQKGKVFWTAHVFFGPQTHTRHVRVASLPPKIETEHGRLIAGRVEIYHGQGEKRQLLAVASCGKPPKSSKRWWQPEDDFEGKMFFYKPKTHPAETNTLRRLKSAGLDK